MTVHRWLWAAGSPPPYALHDLLTQGRAAAAESDGQPRPPWLPPYQHGLGPAAVLGVPAAARAVPAYRYAYRLIRLGHTPDPGEE